MSCILCDKNRILPHHTYKEGLHISDHINHPGIIKHFISQTRVRPAYKIQSSQQCHTLFWHTRKFPVPGSMSLCWIVMVFTHTRGLPRGELHTSARPSWKRPSTPGGILCPPLLSRPHQEAAAAGQQSDAAWELEISEQREHQMASCPPGRTGTRRCQLENSTWSKSCSL